MEIIQKNKIKKKSQKTVVLLIRLENSHLTLVRAYSRLTKIFKILCFANNHRSKDIAINKSPLSLFNISHLIYLTKLDIN